MMALAGSKERVENVWPLHGDKKQTANAMVLTREMYERIKQAHGLN